MAASGLMMPCVSGFSAQQRRGTSVQNTNPTMLAHVGCCSAARTVRGSNFAGQAIVQCTRQPLRAARAASLQVYAVKDGAVLDRPLRVAVVGGGPAGACAADSLAKGGIETYLFERKLDNCKVSTYSISPCLRFRKIWVP